MPTNEPLKKCLFCGSNQATDDGIGVNHYVMCLTCLAYGPSASTMENARRLWNQREGEK